MRRRTAFGSRLHRGRRCPEAGDTGWEPVRAREGLRAYMTHGETGCMFPVRLQRVIGNFDGHPVWLWEWTAGPDRGKIEQGYGRGLWVKERKR